MASQPVMSATARESRANARDDMAVLTSGARHKVDTAMANMQAFGKKMLHPMDKAKKADVDTQAEQQKKESRDKRDMIRSLSAKQADSERAAARGMVAKGVEETGGARYPVLVKDDGPPSSQPSQAQEVPESDSHGFSDRQEGLNSGSHVNQPSPSEKSLHDGVPASTQSRNMHRSVEKDADLRDGDTTEASQPGVDRNGAEDFDRKVEEA